MVRNASKWDELEQPGAALLVPLMTCISMWNLGIAQADVC
jgi:hypothetical protein